MDLLKSSGETQPFDPVRLARSLSRSHVSSAVIQDIVHNIERLVRPGTSTQEIHRRVLHLLTAQDPIGAARYNLKHALFSLGPSGYPFEQYVAKLFEAHGWSARTSVFVRGRCVQHEVDVYATREGHPDRAIEAKYRNTASGRVDVKVALYVHARHLDLTAHNDSIEGMLVTNTQFTTDAVTYGECVEMRMMGWNYPADKGFATMIESRHLYPISVFPHISKKTLHALVNDGIVLAHQLCTMPLTQSSHYHLTTEQLSQLSSFAQRLCPASGEHSS